MVRKALAVLALTAAVASGASVAQAAAPAAPEAKSARCSIYLLGPVTEARQRMNQIRGSLVYATKQVAKYRKAVKNAKSKTAAKRAAKKLKTAKADQKAHKESLPGAIQRFNERNARAVMGGCPPDDGKPKGPRG